MDVIIGLEVKKTVLKKGDSICPYCNKSTQYKVKRNVVFFTFLFLPVVPLKSTEEYVECEACKEKYTPVNKELFGTFPQRSDYTIGTLSRRGGAFIIDILLLLIFNLFLAVFLGKNPELKTYLPDNFILSFLPFWFLYFFLSETISRGYTLGKKALSVRISRNADFGSLSLLRSIFEKCSKNYMLYISADLLYYIFYI